MGFYLKLSVMALWAVLVSSAELGLLPLRLWDRNLFAPWVRRLSRGMLAASGLKTRFLHPQRLRQEVPCVLMGNHQSAMDMATFGRYIPDPATAIGKREILFIPIVGWCRRGRTQERSPPKNVGSVRATHPYGAQRRD